MTGDGVDVSPWPGPRQAPDRWNGDLSARRDCRLRLLRSSHSSSCWLSLSPVLQTPGFARRQSAASTGTEFPTSRGAYGRSRQRHLGPDRGLGPRTAAIAFRSRSESTCRRWEAVVESTLPLDREAIRFGRQIRQHLSWPVLTAPPGAAPLGACRLKGFDPLHVESLSSGRSGEVLPSRSAGRPGPRSRAGRRC